MKKDEFDFVALRDLRVGLFVDLDVGWMAHPFSSSRFKISNERHIEILRGLGVDPIRYVPSRSDPVPVPASHVGAADVQAVTARTMEASKDIQLARQQKVELLAAQQRSLSRCEHRFAETVQQYRKTVELVQTKPVEAASMCVGLAQDLACEIQEQGETAIRLLTEAAGDKSFMHPVNVTVLSLLLGRAMGMQGQELVDLGAAAFLHDIGKVELPERLRRQDDAFSSAETKAYQSHVAHGVRLAGAMQLGPRVVQAIAQHHELADGSGFPGRLKLEAQGAAGRILALVDRYDGLCNPARLSAALTPHEALALIFAQLKTRFDGAALSAFIRMIGVYPPGSVVQLNDERHALVVSVNSARPLKPRVLVHDGQTPRHEALILDLELAPNASIRRSLKPSSLPAAVLDYLQPRQRICYFLEPAGTVATPFATA